MLTAACCTTGCRRLNAQSTVVKMRRLARAYQAKLNFYLINRGELPDYEGAAGAAGDGRSVVVGAVSALRAKQPYDFTFDPHSELSVEKLKEWIDLFLAGKLKKVRSHRSSYAQLQLAHVAAVALRRARPSKSCRTATLSRLTTRSGPCISTTWQSGIKQWATWTLPCNRCVEATTSHTAYPLLLKFHCFAAGGSAGARSSEPHSALQHGPSPRDDRRDGGSNCRVQTVA